MIAFFTDPVLRAPTLGCMLISLSLALIGTIVYLRKQSLIGEALSHCTYPGVIIGVIISGSIGLTGKDQDSITLAILLFATLFAFLGSYSIRALLSIKQISSDVALCTALSLFFGVGILLASGVQFTYPELYRQSFIYLFGQAATIRDSDLWLYASLTAAISLPLLLFYKEIHLTLFDQEQATLLGLPVQTINGAIFALIVFAVVVGIRAVGIVLISSMLISPAVAARQYTDHFKVMLPLSALFGIVSGFFGNYFSVNLAPKGVALPTGPMIVLTASSLSLLSLLFSPKRGLFPKMWAKIQFRIRCLSENLLKGIWKIDPETAVPFTKLKQRYHLPPFLLYFLLTKQRWNGWIEKEPDGYRLTPDGSKRAAQIVRLHRLWELYLATCLNTSREKVHKSAEEMEHILTPALEKELTERLNNPRFDPHHQPIPKPEECE